MEDAVGAAVNDSSESITRVCDVTGCNADGMAVSLSDVVSSEDLGRFLAVEVPVLFLFREAGDEDVDGPAVLLCD